MAAPETISFEYALSKSSDWLEELRQVMVELSDDTGGPVVLPPRYAADVAKGLGIILNNLNAMQAALPAPPRFKSTEPRTCPLWSIINH